MIRFNCHRCGMLIQAADTGAGRDAKCPGCGLMLVIPAGDGGIPTPPPAPAGAASEPAAPADGPAAAPVPPGPTPVPPVVAPVPPSAPPHVGGAILPPSGVAVPPGPASGSSGAGARPLGGFPIFPGAMPVPPGGMPVPLRGGPLGFPGSSGLPDSALFDRLLDDASRTDWDSSAGLHDNPNKELSSDAEHGIHQNASISDAGLRNLGLAAIALGIAGFGLFWVPFAGLALAVVGLTASGAATVVGASRRGAPLGLALAGAVIGVVATAFGGYSTYASLNQSDKQVAGAGNGRSAAGAPAPGAAARGETGVKPLTLAPAVGRFDPDKFAWGAYRAVQSSLAKEIASASTQPRPKNGRPRLVFGGGDNGLVISAAKPEGNPEASATDKRSDGAAGEAPIQWAAAEKGEPQGTGPLQVTVSKVVIGKVVSYPIGDLQTLINVTGEPYLIIWLKIKNTDAAGSAEFTGWMSPQAEEVKVESLLVDDHGREHKPVRPFNKDEAIQRTTPPGKIFAGQTANDAIVFRVLADDVDSMDLTLSGKAIGRDEDLHFRIPRSMIVHDNSNPLLGGAGK